MTRDEIIDELHKPGKSGTLIERALDEIDRLRAELAAKDARIAELVTACGAANATLKIESDLLVIARTNNEALRKELTNRDARLQKALQAVAEMEDELSEAKSVQDDDANVRRITIDRAIADNEALSKELAEAKAVLASYANAGDGLVSLALEKANARIAELEAWKAHHDEVWKESTDTVMEWQDKATRAERAEARIAELEGKLTDHTNLTNAMINTRDGAYDAVLARAERAEAECLEWALNAGKAAGLYRKTEAERDDLRGVLEQLESILVRGDKSVSYMLMKVRAALNPATGEKS